MYFYSDSIQRGLIPQAAHTPVLLYREGASRLASLKYMRFLVFSYFTTKKLLSTVDVQGKMVVRPPNNLCSNGYVL